ncbi:hypothetical protein DFH06DRAFT_757126 [Mycena polygramma]|nr:hypothetical protein DFH06DRAFT_757126 [Mycena polygramma]
MPFIDLGTDVLSRIFALTDVYTILSLSQVNLLFHAICSTKQLWLSITRGLSAHGLIDALPVALDTLSKDELVEEVRRVVDGPRTWAVTSKTPPRLSRLISIPVRDINFSGKLLHGARYIMVYSTVSPVTRGVECFETHSGRRAWSWSRPGLSLLSATFNFHVGTEKATVVLSGYSRITARAVRRLLLLLEADLQTGQSRDLVQLPFLMDSPQLHGDFVLFEAQSGPSKPRLVSLMNWRTEEFVVINQQEIQRCILLPHCVAIAQPVSGSPHAHRLHLYPLTNFDFWRPLSEFNTNGPMHLDRLASIHLPIPDNNLPATLLHKLALSVNLSPVHDETYELVIRVTDFIRPPPLARLDSLLAGLRIGHKRTHPDTTQECISRYHIVLPARVNSSGSPQLILKSTFRHSSRDFPFRPASGAGYALRRHYAESILVYRLDEGAIRNPKELSLANHAQLTYSGTVVVLEGSHLMLYYYQ